MCGLPPCERLDPACGPFPFPGILDCSDGTDNHHDGGIDEDCPGGGPSPATVPGGGAGTPAGCLDPANVACGPHFGRGGPSGNESALGKPSNIDLGPSMSHVGRAGTVNHDRSGSTMSDLLQEGLLILRVEGAPAAEQLCNDGLDNDHD